MGVFFSSFFFYEYPYYYSQLISNDLNFRDLEQFGFSYLNYCVYYNQFNHIYSNNFFKINGVYINLLDLFNLGHRQCQNCVEYPEFFLSNYFITLDIFKEIEHWDMKDEDLPPMDGKSYYPINNFYWLSSYYDYFLTYKQQPSFSAKQKYFNYSSLYGTSRLLENYYNFFSIYGFDNNYLSTSYILYFNSPMRYLSRFLNDAYCYFFGFKNDLLFDFTFLIKRGYINPFSYKEDYGVHFFYLNNLFFDSIKDSELKIYEKNYAFSFYSLLYAQKHDVNVDNFIVSDLSNIYRINEHSYNFLGQDIRNNILRNDLYQYLSSKKLNDNLYKNISNRGNFDYSYFFNRIDSINSENLGMQYKFIFLKNDCFHGFIFPNIKY